MSGATSDITTNIGNEPTCIIRSQINSNSLVQCAINTYYTRTCAIMTNRSVLDNINITRDVRNDTVRNNTGMLNFKITSANTRNNNIAYRNNIIINRNSKIDS